MIIMVCPVFLLKKCVIFLKYCVSYMHTHTEILKNKTKAYQIALIRVYFIDPNCSIFFALILTVIYF